MIKRLGKNIQSCELNLAVVFNEHEIYRELILTERNKLMHFDIKSTIVNETEGEFRKDKHEEDNFMSGFSGINGVSQDDSSMVKGSSWFENEAKRLFV